MWVKYCPRRRVSSDLSTLAIPISMLIEKGSTSSSLLRRSSGVCLIAPYMTPYAHAYHRNPVKNSIGPLHTSAMVRSVSLSLALLSGLCPALPWAAVPCWWSAAHTLNNRIKNDNPKIRRHQRATRTTAAKLREQHKKKVAAIANKPRRISQKRRQQEKQ